MPEPLEFSLEVQLVDKPEEELDGATRQLLSELKEMEIESARLENNGITPPGAKGDPITVGTIALVVLPAVLPKVIELVQSWSLRGPGRAVKFKGRGIEFEGSADELKRILDILDARKKQK